MKSTKFVKAFENFKINEEAPYDFEVGDKKINTWTLEERKDLEELGADEIGDNIAKFIEKKGLIITIEKKLHTSKTYRQSSYTIRTPTYDYLATSNQTPHYAKIKGYHDEIAMVNAVWGIHEDGWKSFLVKLHHFIKNKGLIQYNQYSGR